MVVRGEMFPGESFEMHEHSNLDNLLWVESGTLRHEDSLGNDVVVPAKHASLMKAGASMEHAEATEGSENTMVVLFWFVPDEVDGASSYELGRLEPKPGHWQVIAAGPDAPAQTDHTEMTSLRTSATVYRAELSSRQTIEYKLTPGRRAYFFAAWGDIRIDGHLVADSERAHARVPAGMSRGSVTVSVQALDRAIVFVVEVPDQERRPEVGRSH
jgi:redox-sensitive bicupin YhaK (pirin superfamily)